MLLYNSGVSNEPGSDIEISKEIITEVATPARVKIYNSLAPSGFTPIPIENIDPDKMNGIKEFHVIKIQGPTWEDLIAKGQTPVETHVQIAKTTVLELLELKRMGFLLSDRQASNVILTNTGEINKNTVKQIDLVNTSKVSTETAILTGLKIIPNAEEAIVGKEVANSLKRAILSAPNGKDYLHKLDNLSLWLDTTKIVPNSDKGFLQLNEAINRINPSPQ